jgi:tetratricopeptide (TPR) repeat protein
MADRTPSTTAPDPAQGAPASDALELPVGRGTALGRYLVTGVLGAGGMGAVYTAYDPELDRRVAIKLVRDPDEPSQRAEREERLRREARAMARLVHPNVVRVYDVGARGARTFISMELVEGRTLRAWLHQEPRPRTREVVAAFVGAGRGLSAAHQAGLLHRDFKPDNVFVASDGPVKVGDFGLARAVGPARPSLAPGADAAEDASRAESGGGTPAYLAPEVIAGGPHSPASDQFSFCVSLWEGLYGQRPFGSRAPLGLLEEIRARRPQPASTGGVPGWLRQIALRGLDPDPAARHPSMAALLDALERRPRARRLLLAAVAVAGVAAVVLGASRVTSPRCTGAAAELASTWGDARRAALEAVFRDGGQREAWPAVERALSSFAASWIDVHTRSCRATRVDGRQSEEVLERRARCLNQQRELVSALGDLWLSGQPALLAAAPAALSSLPLPAICGGEAPLNAARMAAPAAALASSVEGLRSKLSVAAARLAAGDPVSALPLASDGVEAARRLGYEPLEAESLLVLAEVQLQRGEQEAAEHALRDAVLAAVAGRHERALAEAMVRLAHVVAVARYRFDDGDLLVSRAAPVVAWLGDRKLSADLELVRGNLRLQRGDAEGARAIFAAALGSLQGLVGADHPSLAQVHHNLFLSAYKAGRNTDARAEAEETLRLLERGLPPGHVRLYPALMDLGTTDVELGRWASAQQLYERAVRIVEKAQGAEGAGVAAALSNLAAVLAMRGEIAAARAAGERALRISDKVRGPLNPLTSHLEAMLGELLWSSGESAQALAHLARGAELRERRFGRRHAETAEVLAVLGRARLDAGRADGLALVLEADATVREVSPNARRREHTAHHACEALLEAGRPRDADEHCRRALDAAREARPQGHPANADELRLLAELDLAQGRAAAARDALEPALGALERLDGAWPHVLMNVRFALARALREGQDPTAVARSAEQARAALELARRVGARPARLASIESFLRSE